MNLPALPPTRRSDQVEYLHGERVADPFRWLEETDSAETVAWVHAQAQVTRAWLDAVSTRGILEARLIELFDHARDGVPFERGGRYFQLRNAGLENQPVLYVMDAPDDDGAVLLDPNRLSNDGTVALSGLSVTSDGSLLAYATSEAGSDWMTWHVRDVETRADLADRLEWSKFSDASWRKDRRAFYYRALDPPAPGAERLDAVGRNRICLHVLGSDQSEDEAVIEFKEQPEWLADAAVTDDGRYLVQTVHHGTDRGAMVRVVDLEDPMRLARPLTNDFSCRAEFVTNVGSTFYVLTDAEAERQRLVAIDLAQPGREHWTTIVAEREVTLVDVACVDRRLVLHHLEHACSRLSVVELDGAYLRDIPLEPVVCVSDLQGRPSGRLLHFMTTSFSDPGTIVEHDLATGHTRRFEPRAAHAIDAARRELITEQVFVPASDGARIPLFLTHRRGLEATGEVPVLLQGYGGFAVATTPRFRHEEVIFAERGGIVALAALRGGGEYGRSWYDAGRLANKQRVFDDFAECARYLVSSGWTRSRRIAANGRSNGGLLVGALLTQHPELIGAAVPEVGVLDMLRFHRFTIGWAWKSDYGDPDDSEQYQWVRAYSPLHHVVAGTVYPPTLVMTGDHDDRVVPGHSFKFTATMQAAQANADGGPTLLRVERSAGHGAGKPTQLAIAERADLLAFLDATIGDAGFDEA